ncbi:MoxR family ATPase [Saccharophagus sp. K07]|jgi:MoxR-like ATPase|uniref:AAA family ATPase n=1 Tax=Saccharophagus sp. K07 TaxID=2283636 RepID=UPI0016524FAF|nr:MoxR family ATPase [Saccharophagus sp. K07]MBC6906918.1 MoxR family ATPase [Saccharophagus sp. K07]
MNPIINSLIERIGQVLLGKDLQVRLALACLLARGHLLIEDLPGMGKTTLAQCLAAVLGLKYERVQFTSDLLPTDILGVSIFDKGLNAFTFHPGPIFTQVLLADEINRTTPKTQSALLEAMEEGQVTIDGETRQLPKPFFVIATQNPIHQSGTFPLPESQLDRFLMRITLGYPSAASERLLLKGDDPRASLKTMESLISTAQLNELQQQAHDVKASDAVIDYLQRLVERTRRDSHFAYGLSPRGAMAWLRAAKAWALIHGRAYVVPEDLQTVMGPVVGHRVHGRDKTEELLDHLLTSVDVLA